MRNIVIIVDNTVLCNQNLVREENLNVFTHTKKGVVIN